MNILSFDVAGPIGSIAVFKDGQCAQYSENPEKKTHSGKLVPLIEKTLKDSGLTYKDLDHIVTCRGPGSFTGIRIGLATAKGIGLSSAKPVISFTAFEAGYKKCRESHPESLPVLVVVDALREDVYCQFFDKDGKPKPPLNLLPQEIHDYVGRGKFILTGTGAMQVQEELFSRGVDFVEVTTPYTAKDLAEMILSLSKESLKALEKTPLEPFYLRPPDIGGK